MKSPFRLLALVLTLSLAGMPLLAVAQTIEELSQQGNAAQSAGNYTQAESIWRRVIQVYPNNSVAYNNLGDALRQQGKVEEAIIAYRQAIQLDPKFALAYYNLGYTIYNYGRLEEAYRQAIQVDLKSNTYYYNSDEAKLEQAITAYRQAIQLDPKFVYAYIGLGDALRDYEKLEDAIAAYRQAIQLDPKFALAYNHLGTALYKQGKLDEEIAAYRQAIQLDPKYAGAYYNLGHTLYNQGKLEEALAALGQAIELDPKFAEAYAELGNALYNQGKVEKAIAALRQAIELEPKNARAYNNLGSTLADQGKLEEAIANYRQALSLPDTRTAKPFSVHTFAHYGLGYALQKQGNLEQAIEEYKRSLQIDPNFVYASNNLNEAERLLNLRRNPQVEARDDRPYLPKNDPSFPILRPVVRIIAEFSSSDIQGSQKGTGLVIQREGNRTLIITNRHVILDQATGKQGQNIQVEFFSEPPSGKLRMRRNARVLGMTPPTDNLDIAVLEVTDPLPDDIKPLPTSSNPIQRQMSVRAIGHPVRGIPWSIEPGTISSYNSQQLQISGTAIQAGNSGGPVINSENQLLGIVVEVDEGLGFAYSMPVIMEKLRALGIK
ncbi:tetratricopeptide repeat protein [Microcoleus sp. Pol14C6]|uniref:tetratricopeptide repeat protein n=1 Tax=unclassified Microcoleus TaxID=2642155 RepID=UPI002FD3B94B